MSHTTRRDPIDAKPKRPDTVFMGMAFSATPTPREKRRAHMDRKKWHKPGRAAKAVLNKGAKAKKRRALEQVTQDPDNAPMPVEKHDHVWLYA